MLCLEIIPFFIAPAPLLEKQHKDLCKGNGGHGRKTRQHSEPGRGIAMVKGSSESMEEVTRVNHFVGSSGKESAREREGGGERGGGGGRSPP